MATIIKALMIWIAAHSTLIVAAPPRIQFVAEHALKERYHSNIEGDWFFKLRALYLPEEQAIYLPDTWHADDLLDQSVLLHELVHHLQKANNFKTSCPAAWERLAYGLQYKWLREQGVEDPFDFIGTNALTVVWLGTCPE